MVSKEYFGEGKNIEYKREIPSNHEKFLKDIIAFSNSTGGQVVVGIEDETHIVYGIGEQSPFKLSDAISNMISDACSPQIEPDISIQTVEDKTILVIDVMPGKFRPYYLASKGKETSAYIRINGTSRPADARKLQELELEGQNISYDALQEIGSEYDETKALDLCRKMKQIALDSCENEEEKLAVKDMTLEKLHDFGILCRVGRNPYPTHAFDLLTDNTNKAAKVQCALFKGKTRDIFIDKKEFNGPIYEQVDDAYQFALRHINMGAEIEGEYRKDVYELPISAIREMIANAVLHRSYLDKSCVQVCLYDDRLEVSSPGMLYGGLDLKTAKLGKSTCRNEVIAEAFHYMHIVEAWGTGLPRIINRCKEYGLPDPLFEEFGDGFKVTIFRKVSNALELLQEKNDFYEEKIVDSKKKAVVLKEKQLIEEEKTVDLNKKQSFEQMMEQLKFSKPTENNIRILHERMGNEVSFGRKDVVQITGITSSPAGELLKKMKSSQLIEDVKGQGKGKYKFTL
jgi:predicted HTH transcriptional regulator